MPEIIEVAETTSTNNYLSLLCDKRPVGELTCVYTHFQTAGRGQRGNSWESERGKNLLFSFVVFPSFLEARRQFLLSQVTALSLHHVLSEYTDDIAIKWPNDIYWKDRKLCGTLIENELTGSRVSRSISGTGINVNQEHFTSNAPNPVSLRQITGKEHGLSEILQQVLEQISRHYFLLQAGNDELISTRYASCLYRRKGFHPYRDKEGCFRACIAGVEPDGKLLLQDETGRCREYMFKEVEYIL